MTTLPKLSKPLSMPIAKFDGARIIHHAVQAERAKHEWQDIATAPKDRPILATNGVSVHEVVYSPKGTVTEIDGTTGPKSPFPWEFLHKGKGDVEASVDAWFFTDVIAWMPLPSPPSAHPHQQEQEA